MVRAGLWQIMIKECRLVWRVQDFEYSRDSGHLMFLVAAKDKQSMFYHVATVSSSAVEVAQDILRKAEKLIILSVSENGIQERHQVQVEEDHKNCKETQDSLEDIWSSQSEPLVSQISEESSILPIIILSIVVSLLVVALAVLVRVVTKHCRGDTEKVVERGEENKNLIVQRVMSEARDNLEYYEFEVVDLSMMEKRRVFRSSCDDVYISRSVVV